MADNAEKSKNINYNSSAIEKLYVAIQPNLEVSQQGYVWFNSDSENSDNALPNKLIDLYKNASSLHSNFINLKANLIYGSQGLIPMDKNNEAVKQALITPNRAGENLDEIFRKMAMDFAIFEASALQVVYNSENKIAEIYHVCPSYLRGSKCNDYGYVEHWLYNENWGIVQNKRIRKPANMVSQSVKIANFNPATGVEDQRQILYIKKYTSAHETYAIPSYNAGLPYVQLDYELSKFHLNKVAMGFAPSVILYLKGNPSEEEKKKFSFDFDNKHIGVDNVGRKLLIWGDGEEQKPEIVRMDADTNVGAFEELNKLVDEKIAAAHGASLDLAGIVTGGASLGGDANRLNVSRAAFIDQVIVGFQNTLLAGINKILKVNGIGEVTVSNDPLKITQPIAQPDDLTRDERRSILYGLPPLDNTEDNVDENGVPIVNPNKVEVPVGEQPQPEFNKNLAGLSGKEFINMMRIIRNIKNGKLSKAAGELLLKSSYGLNDELISTLLVDDLDNDSETI